MKRFIPILGLCALMACGSNTGKNQDSTSVDSAAAAELAAEQAAEQARLDSIEKVKADSIAEVEKALKVDEEQKAFIDSFYTPTSSINEAKCRKFGTKKLMRQLAADYEYDDEGYAYWNLAYPCCQESGPIKYLGATKKGDNQWQVKLRDPQGCGRSSTINIYLAEEGGTWKIDKYQNVN